MTVRADAVIAILIAASLLVRGPVSAAAEQRMGTLPHGGEYVIDPDPTVAAATVGLWFRAPGAGYENATPGVSRLAATAAAVAPLESGRSLFQLVHGLGGSLDINVYPDIVGIDAVIPASAVREVVAGMTSAYFTPSIDEAAVRTAQRDSAVLAVQERYNADAILHDLLFAQIFSAGPAHYPPLPGSVADLTRIQPAQVLAFAKRAFRSQNAIVTLAGNVDPSSLDAMAQGSGAESMDPPYDSTVASAPGSTAATGVVSGIGLAWVGPPIADQKAATALDFVADYLFRERTGIVAKSIAGNEGVFLSGQFITLHDPGVMLVTIGSDELSDADVVKRRVLAALDKLQEPMDPQTFAAAREAFLYHVAADTQTPEEQADNLGWYAVEGSPRYAPGSSSGEYVRDARALDPEFVASVVKHYLQHPVIVQLAAAPPAKESSR
jgi:predicted Zn-dependent peptidase